MLRTATRAAPADNPDRRAAWPRRLLGKLLLGALLLSPTLALAQAIPPKAREAANLFSGANQILVRVPDSTAGALLRMQGVLAAQSYALDTVNARYLTTKARGFAPAGGLQVPIVYVFKIYASPADAGTQLLLTGYLIDDRNPKYHFVIPMQWAGPGDQLPAQLCFAYADEIAKACPQGKVSYRQRLR